MCDLRKHGPTFSMSSEYTVSCAPTLTDTVFTDCAREESCDQQKHLHAVCFGDKYSNWRKQNPRVHHPGQVENSGRGKRHDVKTEPAGSGTGAVI